MATGSATSPEEMIAAAPPERREAMTAVLEVIRANLPPGYEEGMQYGMVGWYVPLERFPDTYNKQPLALAGLANQKNYMSLYLNSVYGNQETERWFQERFAASGKKLNMGKSCVRFRKLEDLPLDVIAETIARIPVDKYIEYYEEARGSSRKTRYAGT